MGKAVGIDVGGSNLRIALIDEKGKVEKKVSHKTQPETLMDTIYDEVSKFSDFEGIGISVAGMLDSKKGTVMFMPNTKIRNLRIGGLLQDKFDVPCNMFNDCVSAVMGEKFFGAGRGFENIVYLTFSTGIGAGVIANDRLLLGKDGNAHEVGHMTIDYDTDLICECGGYGHWECYCSGKGMVKYADRLLRTEYRDEKTILRNQPITPEFLFQSSKHDKIATEIVNKIARIDAMMIGDVVNAYDPEILIIGGSVTLNNKDVLMKPIQELTPKYSINRMPKISVTPLAENVCLIGAGASVFNAEWLQK